MNFHELKAAYDRDGFVIVRQFLPASQWAEIVAELDRYIRDVVPTVPATDAIYDNPTRPESLRQMHRLDQDAYFARWRTDGGAFRALAEVLVDEPVQIEPPEWFNKPPQSQQGTPPHQDNFYFCLRPCHVLTMWLALDRADEENGCLRYIPGSHRRGVRMHCATQTLGFSQGIADYGPADQAAEVPVRLEPGDLAVHHGEMIHRADANRSTTRHRRSFALVMKGESCRRDEAAYARYLDALEAQRKQAKVGV